MGPVAQGPSVPPAAAGGATPLPAPTGPAPTPAALSVTDVLALLDATLRQGMALELWVSGTWRA